jgi:hypothetical protein
MAVDVAVDATEDETVDKTVDASEAVDAAASASDMATCECCGRGEMIVGGSARSVENRKVCGEQT